MNDLISRSPRDADEPTAAPRRSHPFAASRRGIVAALSGGLLTSLPFALASGGAKGKKKRKRRKKNRKGKQNGPSTRADATCPGPPDEAFIVNGGTRLAQTFTVSAGGTLVKAELAINKEAQSSGDYLLSLSPVDNSGVPTNDVLAVALVQDATVPAGESTVGFTFDDPVDVAAGDQLALVVTRLDGGVLTWVSRAGDACAGRGFVSPPPLTAFEFLPGVDFIFTAFVRS